jgi:circadian clock protein KaiB
MPGKRPSANPRKAHAGLETTTQEFERLLKEAPTDTYYLLRLFVTGSTPRSVTAIANIRAICERFLAGRVDLEVVDIYQQPSEARNEQIIAAPTLVRELPKPPRRMVGDLSDAHKVLVGLNLIPVGAPPGDAPETKWMKI